MTDQFRFREGILRALSLMTLTFIPCFGKGFAQYVKIAFGPLVTWVRRRGRSSSLAGGQSARSGRKGQQGSRAVNDAG